MISATERIVIGHTAVTASRLGLGLSSVAGRFRHVGEQQANATIDCAWRLGLRHFDTAPLYGFGLSEQRAGNALHDRPRRDFAISTKVGRRLEPGRPDMLSRWPDGAATGMAPRFDFSYEGTYESLNSSLERLQLDSVDVVYIHDPDNYHKDALAGAYRALSEMRRRGVIRAVGVGMTQTAMLARFAREVEPPGFDCFMLAGRYTLLDQSALDELLPLCLEREISVVIAGVYNSGILASPNEYSHYDYSAPSRAVMARVRSLRAICAKHGVPLRAAALQFSMAHRAVCCAIVGARSPEQVRDTVSMVSVPIPGEFWRDLRSRNLLPEDAPTPA